MGKSNEPYYIDGDSTLQKAARRAVPILVELAIAQSTMTYHQINTLAGFGSDLNVGKALGAINRDMQLITKELDLKDPIPPLSAVIVNKSTELPSKGLFEHFGPYVAKYVGSLKRYEEFSREEKKAALLPLYEALHRFNKWDRVLKKLKLGRAKGLPKDSVVLTGDKEAYGRAGVESEEHKALKRYVARHPECVGLPSGTPHGKNEFTFPSNDTADVIFLGKTKWTAVEVKAAGVPKEEHLRGLFQVKKYYALLDGLRQLRGERVTVRSVLAIGGELEDPERRQAGLMGIVVYENVRPRPNRSR